MNELDIDHVLQHVYKRVFGGETYDMHKEHLQSVLFDKMHMVMKTAKTREDVRKWAVIIIKKWCRECANESVSLLPQSTR